VAVGVRGHPIGGRRSLRLPPGTRLFVPGMHWMILKANSRGGNRSGLLPEITNRNRAATQALSALDIVTGILGLFAMERERDAWRAEALASRERPSGFAITQSANRARPSRYQSARPDGSRVRRAQCRASSGTDTCDGGSVTIVPLRPCRCEPPATPQCRLTSRRPLNEPAIGQGDYHEGKTIRRR
jgi:hypothetical protein